MIQWNEGKIVVALTAIMEIEIRNNTLGEDYTTNQLTYAVENSENQIFIRGFVTEGKPIQDNMIEMVEVTTGYSDGDMPNDPDYCIVYAKVKAAIMRLGYSVVSSLEPYF